MSHRPFILGVHGLICVCEKIYNSEGIQLRTKWTEGATGTTGLGGPERWVIGCCVRDGCSKEACCEGESWGLVAFGCSGQRGEGV